MSALGQERFVVTEMMKLIFLFAAGILLPGPPALALFMADWFIRIFHKCFR